MGINARRKVKNTTRRVGVLRRSVAQLAVLGLVAGGAVFAFSVSAGADQHDNLPDNCAVNSHHDNNPDALIGQGQWRQSLQICKSGPETAVAGTDITYTLTDIESNHHNWWKGKDDLLTVDDVLPSGTTLVGTPTGADWDCSASTDSEVICTHDNPWDWKNNDLSDISFTVHIDSSYTGDSIRNCATLELTQGWDNADNQVSTDTPSNDWHDSNITDPACWDTSVTQVSDLAITKSGPTTAKAPGDVTYNVTVTNNGPSDSGAITVSDPLPAGATYESSSGTGWSCSGSTTVVCTHAGLADGDSSTYSVTVHLDASFVGQSLQNCVSVTGGDTSDVASNDTACSNSIPQVAPVVQSVVVVRPVVVSPVFTG